MNAKLKICAALVVSTILLSTFAYFRGDDERLSLLSRIQNVARAAPQHTEISCPALLAARPVVLLALGQSNAGNHGSSAPSSSRIVPLIADGKCILATDPLPGGTGTGASIWLRLPVSFQTLSKSRPVVLSILAVESTPINDWTRIGSPLKNRLESQLASLKQLGFAPNFVLWQQGEADALIGTSKENYLNALKLLADILHTGGSPGPILLARSTVCRTGPNEPIRDAISTIALVDQRFIVGPDTDVLMDSEHRDGCHFTAAGLERAAAMWTRAIEGQLNSQSKKQ